jgi:hypothetical protein
MQEKPGKAGRIRPRKPCQRGPHHLETFMFENNTWILEYCAKPAIAVSRTKGRGLLTFPPLLLE